MPRWTELHTYFMGFMGQQQAEVELMAMAWRQAALKHDPTLNSNLASNQWSIAGMCALLDWCGVQPDEITLEWARDRGG